VVQMAKIIVDILSTISRYVLYRFYRARYLFMNHNPIYSKYQIGAFSYGSPTILWDDGKSTLKIGKFCAISGNVVILLGGEHRIDWVTTYPFNTWDDLRQFKGHPNTKGDVTLGNDVWIGMNSIILSGVSIGDGAVVGAGSTVTNDVPPYAVVAGSPARILKFRFNEETVKKLLLIRWWDWNLDRIRNNMPLLLSNNIEQFIERNQPE
jgi:virginiamycin A acetyltransferase